MTSDNSGDYLSLDELDPIVDADSHLAENVDQVLEHFEPKDEGIRRRIKEASKPHVKVFNRGGPTPNPNTAYKQADHKGESGYDVSKKLEEMKDHQIDCSFLNPGPHGAINSVSNTRFATALARAYNAFVIDLIDDQEDMKAGLLIAARKPNLAAEEIDDRSSEDAFGAVAMPPAALAPPAGDFRYDPIFQAAAAADLPVVFHSTGGIPETLPTLYKWSETAATEHAVIHPFIHMWNIASLLFQGVPHRYPDLRFIFQEAGISYLPYLKWRLDDHYLEYQDDVPTLDRLPSTYIEEQFYFTTQPIGPADHPNHYVEIIKMIGSESIMYSADLPHFDFDPPEELFSIINGELSEAEIRAIMGETAQDIFGF